MTRIALGDARLQFVRFFDWGALGRRDFQYVEVVVVEFPAHPELARRYALLEFSFAIFEFSSDAAGENSSLNADA